MTKKTRTKSHKKKSLIILIVSILIFLGVGSYVTLNFSSIQNEYYYISSKKSQKLDVPLENQFPELPNGCEVTSLSMLLNYYGVKVTKMRLAHDIEHVSSFSEDGQYRGDPNDGFVGYMSIAKAGWCVYNGPLYDVGRKFTSRMENLTGSSFNKVIKTVSDGHPVVIITTLNFKKVNDMQKWSTRRGYAYVTPSSHACVITGYDKDKNIVYVNDPYGEKNKAVSWKNIEASYNQQGKQALTIK